MALSAELIDRHIATRTAELANKAGYSYRSKWPAHLFHHAPLEAASAILSSGELKSRNATRHLKLRDVAAPGVIDTRTDAHDSARLYFRPRTPTQFNIEGIRKPDECKYGGDTHAPTLYMFIFDARPILLSPHTKFTDKNAQIASPADDEDYFERIPFEKVYHEGSFQGDASILQHRCAEVLAQSPLTLDPCLKWVYCRSIAERETLLATLHWQARRKWSDRILVSDDLRVFEKTYAFVGDVRLGSEGVSVRFNPRRDLAPVDLRVGIWQNETVPVLNWQHPEWRLVPPAPDVRWLFGADLVEGFYRVRIWIEGHLAYDAELAFGDPVF